jgi:hypothetical protein
VDGPTVKRPLKICDRRENAVQYLPGFSVDTDGRQPI